MSSLNMVDHALIILPSCGHIWLILTLFWKDSYRHDIVTTAPFLWDNVTFQQISLLKLKSGDTKTEFLLLIMFTTSRLSLGNRFLSIRIGVVLNRVHSVDLFYKIRLPILITLLRDIRLNDLIWITRCLVEESLLLLFIHLLNWLKHRPLMNDLLFKGYSVSEA